MIKNITKIISIPRLTHQLALPFSDKAEILKTYLEIIPPHKIYELKQKQQHSLETALVHA
jgi:esterase/lipase